MLFMRETNFWGAAYGTLYAIPHLKNSKGRIIVVASACGWFPIPRLSIYNASKAAIISFFETLRIELGWSIGITIATPGFINTNLASRVIEDEVLYPELVDWAQRHILLGLLPYKNKSNMLVSKNNQEVKAE
ncbi:hydroxysteroid dehydrogenase [Trifolium repens]|nr:hydroxysteroid dehydrogenase [Trifolium repens]